MSKRKYYSSLQREDFFEPLSFYHVIFERIMQLCKANYIFHRRIQEKIAVSIMEDVVRNKENIRNVDELLNITLPNLFLTCTRSTRSSISTTRASTQQRHSIKQ